MAPERIVRGRRASRILAGRNVRGAGWHRRGYRDHGRLWLNVNEGSYTRGRDVQEREPLDRFARSLDEKPDNRGPEGMWCDVFFRKKSIFDLADENPGDTVEDWFDGGETVYRKYYDRDGWELKDHGMSYQRTGKLAHRLRFVRGEEEGEEGAGIPEMRPVALQPARRRRIIMELRDCEREMERHRLGLPKEEDDDDEEKSKKVVMSREDTGRVARNTDRRHQFQAGMRRREAVQRERLELEEVDLLRERERQRRLQDNAVMVSASSRQQARAVGRSPQEIAGLERALAARRARRARLNVETP